MLDLGLFLATKPFCPHPGCLPTQTGDALSCLGQECQLANVASYDATHGQRMSKERA